MAKQHLQPAELFPSQRFGFTQVVTSPPGTLVFVSGQGAFDVDFKLVGGDDLTAQADQALANLGHALRAAGATPADVTSLRIYVVDYRPEQAMALGAPLQRFFGDAPPPAQTLIGVQALACPACSSRSRPPPSWAAERSRPPSSRLLVSPIQRPSWGRSSSCSRWRCSWCSAPTPSASRTSNAASRSSRRSARTSARCRPIAPTALPSAAACSTPCASVTARTRS